MEETNITSFRNILEEIRDLDKSNVGNWSKYRILDKLYYELEIRPISKLCENCVKPRDHYIFGFNDKLKYECEICIYDLMYERITNKLDNEEPLDTNYSGSFYIFDKLHKRVYNSIHKSNYNIRSTINCYECYDIECKYCLEGIEV